MSIGFLSQAWRLFALSDNRFSKNLFVPILINPQKIKTHGGTEIQRCAIV